MVILHQILVVVAWENIQVTFSWPCASKQNICKFMFYTTCLTRMFEKLQHMNGASNTYSKYLLTHARTHIQWHYSTKYFYRPCLSRLVMELNRCLITFGEYFKLMHTFSYYAIWTTSRIVALGVMAPCRLASGYRGFGGTRRFHFQVYPKMEAMSYAKVGTHLQDYTASYPEHHNRQGHVTMFTKRSHVILPRIRGTRSTTSDSIS